jgi:uncharacterized protein (TIGR03000 family)
MGAAHAYAGGLVTDALVEGPSIGQLALVFVELPSDATLTVDGTATTSTSSNRVFVTPALEAGRTYTYTLTAQVMRDGSLQTVTREVPVRAGEETRVRLDMPVAGVAVR